VVNCGRASFISKSGSFNQTLEIKEKLTMQELKITMLGSRNVGKTTLLTAMYEQFANNMSGIDLQLTPEEESSAILQERLIELKSLLNTFQARGGIQGTEGEPEDLRSFLFDLGRKGQSPSLRLNFRDYPGGYLLAKATPEQKQFVKTLMTECVAVLVAIDAPALMEAKGRWHEKINRPQQIIDKFATAYQGLQSPRLVILAPVKCEKYVQSEALSLELNRRIKEEYKRLFDLFNSEALQSKIVTVITPVQTVGSVIFSKIEVKDGEPHFMFRKTGQDARYSPKDSEQPLRYLLRFLLKLHLSNNRNWEWFNFDLNFLRDIFGLDDAFINAIRELSKGCKSGNGFSVLQGHSLLDI
jgi:hypothetical protein